MPLPDFEEIEAARSAAGIGIGELCQEAGIAHSTHWRLLRGKNAQIGTLRKLHDALARLKGSRSKPERAGHLVSTFKAYLLAAAAIEGVRVEDALLFNPWANKPRDPEWLRISRVRQAAIYLTVTEFDVPISVLAAALGVSKQAVSKSQRAIEWRRDDPEFDALLDRIAELMKGRAA